MKNLRHVGKKKIVFHIHAKIYNSRLTRIAFGTLYLACQHYFKKA